MTNSTPNDAPRRGRDQAAPVKPQARQTAQPGQASDARDAMRVADATRTSFVYRYLPASALPYAQLARLDRPIGAWLLMFPGWWALALADLSAGRSAPNIYYLALFLIGAIVMRGAGCAYNDIVDREFDANVARTASRPIPSGRVSARQAGLFALALCLIGLLVLLQFNQFTILLGAASVLLIAIYPFMKRITYWPQFILGLAFNWGALIGWSAAQGSIAAPAIILYVGAIAWTIGYDTIYAHQDKEDDLSLGLKSTALRFGGNTVPWLTGFYLFAWSAWAVAAWMAGAGAIGFGALALVGVHFVWQIWTLDIDDGDNCLQRFRANRNVGLLWFAGLAVDLIGRGMV